MFYNKGKVCEIMKKIPTYISLFSSAGVGCYGFKEAGFACVATNELIPRRLKIQEYNNKCKYKTGYISGDIGEKFIQNKILKELKFWQEKEKLKELDVIVATPPCQGMSVANHKKKDEIQRNSLIINSIELVNKIKPRFFVFENVKTFLNTICTDTDGKEVTIENAIDKNLGKSYNIVKKIINFKDYGSNSSRTRTLTIGVRKDLKNIKPNDIFPSKEKEKSLKSVIGKYKSLRTMGEIDKNDIYHHFREYAPKMVDWIKDIKEGQSAFDNTDKSKIPHKVVDGKIVYNKNKNSDKYTRCEWKKVAPCIHTRNDILASQSTIHPTDNRVFSIRELMDIMTIPKTFKWSGMDLKDLNKLSDNEKKEFLKKETINIRESIEEAVPTIIFRKIADNIINLGNKQCKPKK